MKKIFRLIIILSLVVLLPVNAVTTTASKTTSTTTKNYYSYYMTSTTFYNKTGAKVEDNSGYTNLCTRNASNNYGVNKKWDMTQSRISYALNTPCVDVNDKIYDFSLILKEEEVTNIKYLIDSYREKYNIDIIFVSYNLPYTNDHDNEDFIADFYDFNDFGLGHDNYDGLAIFRNTYYKDPYVRIMTFGDAQLYLYDTRYDSLISGVASYFKSNDYDGAVKYTLSYYDSCVSKGPLKGYYIDDMGYIKRKWYPSWGFYTFTGLVVGLIYMLVGLGKHKMVKKAQAAREYFVKDSLELTQQADVFLRSHTSSYTVSSSSGGGGGGHHSSGGHSGGGHSSGGGHF